LKNLVVDIGNSRIKFSEVKNNILGKVSYKDYSKTDFKKVVKEILKEKNSYEKIGISCADVNQNEYLKEKYSKNKNIFFVGTDKNLPIKIEYAKTLGPDRICGALGAVSKFPKYKNFLIIDFGTATTYNLVSNSIFKGGLITPGIKTALASLVNKTTLPTVKLKKGKNLFYNNTLDNISNGVILQNLFFTERIILDYKKKIKNLFIIATGGYAGLIFPLTKFINKKEQTLNLEGLKFFLNHCE
jgi:type III pantothenate kinase